MSSKVTCLGNKKPIDRDNLHELDKLSLIDGHIAGTKSGILEGHKCPRMVMIGYHQDSIQITFTQGNWSSAEEIVGALAWGQKILLETKHSETNFDTGDDDAEELETAETKEDKTSDEETPTA